MNENMAAFTTCEHGIAIMGCPDCVKKLTDRIQSLESRLEKERGKVKRYEAVIKKIASKEIQNLYGY